MKKGGNITLLFIYFHCVNYIYVFYEMFQLDNSIQRFSIYNAVYTNLLHLEMSMIIWFKVM